MPLFWKPYKSDATVLLEALRAERPGLEEEQREGRRRLWERRIDREAEADWRDAKVAQQPYVYATKK